MAKVAFIGLGRMGHGMAGRYLDAGFTVTVWNRSKAKADDLIARGARWASSPADAADGADAVVTMVADDEASRQIWLGKDGAAIRMKAGSLAIECSTVSHQHGLDMARELRVRGLVYIDCPVTGLPEAAATGKLTLLVGADAADLDCARPYLAPIGNVIRHFGAVGTGTVYKLINNLMGAVQIASLAEGIAMAEQAGLDMNLVAEAMAAGAVADPSFEAHGGARLLRRLVHFCTPPQGCGLRGETGREPAGRRAAGWTRRCRCLCSSEGRDARRRRRPDDRDRLAAEIAVLAEIGWEYPARPNNLRARRYEPQ